MKHMEKMLDAVAGEAFAEMVDWDKTNKSNCIDEDTDLNEKKLLLAPV